MKLPILIKKFIKVKYNIILVINDRLIKLVYFIPYKEASSVEDLIYIFLWIIIVVYSLLDKIILDRDKLFILKF